MEKEKILSKIKHNPLFEDLNQKQIEFILSHSELITVKTEEFILHEKELGNEVYLILQGEAKVLKKEKGRSLPIATLRPGDMIGEMALIECSPRSASIQAKKEMLLLLLPFHKKIGFHEKEILHQITLNISKHLSQKIRNVNDLTVQSLKTALRQAEERVESGKFFFLLLIIVCLWVLGLSFTQMFVSKSGFSPAISWSAILAITISNFYLVKTSIHPLTFYGITLKNWQKDLLEGVLFTIPILIGATLFKWILITKVTSLASIPLIEPIRKELNIGPLLQIAIPLIYVALTPLQEFIARGVMQSCTQALLSFHPIFWGNILSNLIFAIFHAHISPLFALASFVVGIFWGWLRYRQNSLTGAIISHALVGGWCLSILHFDRLLR